MSKVYIVSDNTDMSADPIRAFRSLEKAKEFVKSQGDAVEQVGLPKYFIHWEAGVELDESEVKVSTFNPYEGMTQAQKDQAHFEQVQQMMRDGA